MNSNKDSKGGIALAVLTLGTACTILALSTDHWYDVKMVIDGYTDIPGTNVHEYLGLWKVCLSMKISPTPGVSQGLKFSKCFKVDDWKGLKNYAIKQAEADSDAYNIQNTYSNTYGNTNNLGKMGNIFGEVTRRRKRRNIVEPWSDSGDLDENIRTMLYPDYLKGVQAMEILALISGVTAIGVWMAYIAMSTRTRKGVACTVFKIITIVLVMLTAVFHAIGVLVWLIKKNKEMSDALTQAGVRRLPDGIDIYFGWSWGIAVAALTLHLLSIIPLALTKTNQTDDMTERVLPPSEVWTTPQNRRWLLNVQLKATK